ncbi:MAG: ABC transporter ATP-binding protein [Gammaproteobacteria bacterium]|nr:ABC transporter ATP-binding protein [Gammaproteobacteria bacterium]
MNNALQIHNVSIAYGDNTVINNVSFSLDRGEIGSLLGPSGCGKSSILRAIAGFEPVTEGAIQLQGRIVSTLLDKMVPPEERRVGMVFQDFALYPHLTVAKNIAFGLRKLSSSDQQQRVTELLQLIGLKDHADAYPHQLSGGQQQRVALARAMAPRPDILLLDEPFSGLDVELRQQLAKEIRMILKREDITAILVTHDQQEAFAMADKIGVLHQGLMHQWGSGYEIYHRPSNITVAEFIGEGRLIKGKVIDGHHIETALGSIAGNFTAEVAVGHEVSLLLRPDDIIHNDESDNQFEVMDKIFRGADYLYTLKINEDTSLLCMVQSHHNHAIGESIGISLQVNDLVAFPIK